MIVVIHLFSISAALLTCVMATFLLLEVVASLWPVRTKKFKRATPGQIAVVIPAHNEEKIIASTLKNIKGQLRDGDRMIVVADNCTDQTANIATDLGAECLIRNDHAHRGKGYALQFAIEALRRQPPDIVMFIDADCLFADGALILTASIAVGEKRPAQALYMMRAPKGAAARQRVAEFAWLFINQVRMRGLQNLFDVTRFTGAGLAAPWEALSVINMASGQIVEDLAMTFELASRGNPPLLLVDALITSEFPQHDDAQMKQSARWSIGSLTYAFRSGAAWLIHGLFKGRLQLVGAAIDLMIPPLTIFALLVLAVAALSVFSWLFGSAIAIMIAGLAAIQLIAAITLGWVCYGRSALPPAELAAVAQFLGSKFLVFGAKGRATAKTWTPTRGGEHDDHAE